MKYSRKQRFCSVSLFPCFRLMSRPNGTFSKNVWRQLWNSEDRDWITSRESDLLKSHASSRVTLTVRIDKNRVMTNREPFPEMSYKWRRWGCARKMFHKFVTKYWTLSPPSATRGGDSWGQGRRADKTGEIGAGKVYKPGERDPVFLLLFSDQYMSSSLRDLLHGACFPHQSSNLCCSLNRGVSQESFKSIWPQSRRKCEIKHGQKEYKRYQPCFPTTCPWVSEDTLSREHASFAFITQWCNS